MNWKKKNKEGKNRVHEKRHTLSSPGPHHLMSLMWFFKYFIIANMRTRFWPKTFNS